MYTLKLIPQDFKVDEVTMISPQNKGEYTYFRLNKKEINTEKAIQQLTRKFKIKRSSFGYAGNKDKFAVTSQYCSVRGNISKYDSDEFSIEILGRGNHPISLGDLKGNTFTIVVRNIQEKPQPISFFINYFDDQRFGQNNVEVGLALLRKQYAKACELLRLNVNNNDYIGALRTIPFKDLKFMIHAVQSLFFNEVVSKYITSIIDTSEIQYSQGTLAFPKKEIEQKEIPLFAFDTEFKDAKIETLYDEILQKHRLTFRDFVLRSLPGITPQGATRKIVSYVSDLQISEIEDDELNEGMKKCTLTFFLDKGNYATMCIKSMFANSFYK